jgi:hypothetical protein
LGWVWLVGGFYGAINSLIAFIDFHRGAVTAGTIWYETSESALGTIIVFLIVAFFGFLFTRVKPYCPEDLQDEEN